MRERLDYFVTSIPGLEAVLHREVQELGFARVERQVGGVAFVGDVEAGWRANLELRTGLRVLRRVARFQARTADELHAGAREVPWEAFLGMDGTLRVDGRSRESAIDHTQFLEQRVKDAVCDRFREREGGRPGVDKERPDLRINAHLFRDRVTLSADTSGDALHRRGWRVHQGRAPLAETTAAALVLLADWNRRAPLVDPFAGTGTIAIEAALLAAGRAPGLERTFAFEGWPGHDARGFARAKAELRSRAVELPGKLTILGRDNDPERVREAEENAASAGLEGQVRFELGDAREFEPRPGWNATLVTNPPYGVRIGPGAELEALYEELGVLLRTRCVGSSLTLLSGNTRLRSRLGFDAAERLAITSGGLECEVVRVPRIEG